MPALPPGRVDIGLLDATPGAAVQNVATIHNRQADALQAATQSGLTIEGNLAAQIVRGVKLTAPDYAWHAVGGTNEPAFENSWVNFDGVHNAASFRAVPGGGVEIRGLVKSGTAGSTIFTLPAGFRPALNHGFASESNNVFGSVRITASTGVVKQGAGTNDWLFLDGIHFQAASPAAHPAYFSGAARDGSKWPVVVSHGLKDAVTGVVVVGARMLDGTVVEAIGLSVPHWGVTTDGRVKLLSVFGMQPGRTYLLDLLLLTR